MCSVCSVYLFRSVVLQNINGHSEIYVDIKVHIVRLFRLKFRISSWYTEIIFKLPLTCSSLMVYKASKIITTFEVLPTRIIKNFFSFYFFKHRKRDISKNLLKSHGT